jgi:hypothetical protein
MPDERVAGGAIARDDIHDARRKADFVAKFGESKSGEWRELRGLKHDSISSGERRSNFPRQHQQRKIPRNDLADDSAGLVTGEFLGEKLGQPA